MVEAIIKIVLTLLLPKEDKVTESTETPVYRNWKAIYEIPNKQLMLAMVSVDLDLNLGKRLIKQLPEYFTEEEQFAPVPLSLMKAKAKENGLLVGITYGEDLIVMYDAVPENIIVWGFDKSGDNFLGNDHPLLPKEINPDITQGKIVIWENKKFVVLENNIGGEEIYLAPAELVAVDL